MSLAKIQEELEAYEEREGKELTLQTRNIERIKHVLTDFETRKLLLNILSDDYVKKINYADVVDLNDKLKLMAEVVN